MEGHTIEDQAAQVSCIYGRAQNETLSLIQSQPTEAIDTAVCKWMSAALLAEYLQLYNDKNALDYSRNTLVVKANLREQFRFRTLTSVMSWDSTGTRLRCGFGSIRTQWW